MSYQARDKSIVYLQDRKKSRKQNVSGKEVRASVCTPCAAICVSGLCVWICSDSLIRFVLLLVFIWLAQRARRRGQKMAMERLSDPLQAW